MKDHRDIISLARYFSSSLEGIRGRWVYSALLMAISPAFGAGLLWVVKTLIDEVVLARQVETLAFLLSIYLAIALTKAASAYVSARLDVSIAEYIALKNRVRLYQHVLRLSPGSVARQSTGDILTRLSGDVDRIEYLIFTAPIAIGVDILATIVFTASLLILSWKLTLCAIAVAPLFLIVSLFSAGRIRRTARIARHQTGKWTDLAEERLNAVATIQAAGAEAFELARFARRCEHSRRSDINVAKVEAAASGLVEICAIVGSLAILLVGAFVVYRGEMSPGALIAFLGALGSLYAPIRSLAKAPGRLQQAAARVQRVRDLLETPSLVQERPAAKPLLAPKGALEFDQVVFGYSPDKRILDGVSLKVEPGETVAIVGPSGSGKSTLLKLALRLYDPSSGRVLIDGHDIRDLTIASARGAISAVWQEPHLFSGSVADNIRYEMSGLSESDIAAAAEAASMSHHIEHLRGGYDAPVGPAGRWLSGGQRQRIVLARALSRNSPILLLDEATGAVDGETEEHIQDALDRLAGHRTMLIVAHRLSSIRRADRIVVVENGHIVETGSPHNLLRRDSRCRELFSTQLNLEELAA